MALCRRHILHHPMSITLKHHQTDSERHLEQPDLVPEKFFFPDSWHYTNPPSTPHPQFKETEEGLHIISSSSNTAGSTYGLKGKRTEKSANLRINWTTDFCVFDSSTAHPPTSHVFLSNACSFADPVSNGINFGYVWFADDNRMLLTVRDVNGGWEWIIIIAADNTRGIPNINSGFGVENYKLKFATCYTEEEEVRT